MAATPAVHRPLNLGVYRGEADAFDARASRYRIAFSTLAMPLAVALGFAAFRSRRPGLLMSAFAVMGLARSAAHALARRRREVRESRIDAAVEQSFPASDPPAWRS
jgi:hypothetical protein